MLDAELLNLLKCLQQRLLYQAGQVDLRPQTRVEMHPGQRLLQPLAVVFRQVRQTQGGEAAGAVEPLPSVTADQPGPEATEAGL